MARGDAAPRLSIALPTLNAMPFIGEAVASIQAIPELAFEVLVCDGGSTDGTVEYVRELRDARFRLVSRSDRGVPDALNQAFAAARAPVLCWLNADDFYVNQHELPGLVHRLADGGPAWIVAPCALCDADRRNVTLYWPWLPVLSPYRGACNICTVTLFFQRAAFLRFGGFSPDLVAGFEYELIAFLVREGGGQTWPGAPLGGLRLHEATITARWREHLDREREMLVGTASRVERQLARIDQLAEYLRRGLLPRVLRAKRILRRSPSMTVEEACGPLLARPERGGGSGRSKMPR